MTTAPRRRPRRSNSLKDLQRLLPVAKTAYEESRQVRLEVHSAKLNNTEANAFNNYFKIQTANLFLRQFGVQLVANDRSFHISEEWPGMDRRLISGSVFTQTRLFFSSGGIGATWLDDGPAGSALRHLKSLALDSGAPVPLAKQRLRLGLSVTETYGGATSEEKFSATISKRKLNERIMELRDNDLPLLRKCRAYERQELRLDILIGPRITAHEAYVRHVLTSPRKKPIDIGSRGPAGDCKRLDPNNWRVTDRIHRRWFWNGAWRTCPVVVQIANSPPIEVMPTHLHSDDTPQKLVEGFLATGGRTAGEYLLWRDRLPRLHLARWYVRQKIFIHETAWKPEIDKSNIFDRTRGGRDDLGAIFNPLGMGTDKEKPIKRGYAGRSLRKELKAQGIQAKVIDVPDRGVRSYADAFLSPEEKKPGWDWGNLVFDLPKWALDRKKTRAPLLDDPYREREQALLAA